MNNSKIASDNTEEPKDGTAHLQTQQGEWTRIVEAINRVEASSDWQTLKRLLLDGVLAALEKQLISEAERDDVDLPKLYRLQGQVAWAKKYADLRKVSDIFKKQIENIKNQIHGKQNPADGAA